MENLWTWHMVADNARDAARVALTDTSVDIFANPTVDTQHWIYDLVDKGDVPPSRVDTSAGRVLALKEYLGLFDDPFALLNDTDPTIAKLVASVGSDADKVRIMLVLVLGASKRAGRRDLPPQTPHHQRPTTTNTTQTQTQTHQIGAGPGRSAGLNRAGEERGQGAAPAAGARPDGGAGRRRLQLARAAGRRVDAALVGFNSDREAGGR